MTIIKIFRQESKKDYCMVCDIDLEGTFYKLEVVYSRDGFTTTKWKDMCLDCADKLYHALGKT